MPALHHPFFQRSLLIALVMISVVIMACSRSTSSSRPEAVEWPELVELEKLLLLAEQRIADGRTGDILSLRTAILEAGWALDHRSVPTGVEDFDRVQLLLSDLVSKINGLAVPLINKETLEGLILGIRPVMADIIQASGASVLQAD